MTLKEPIWVLPDVVKLMHDMQLAEHGGGVGTRESGLLDSALARPRNLYAYGETDLCRLASTYVFGLSKNHPFVDGNKRTAFLTGYVFLNQNGLRVTATEEDVVAKVLALTSDQIDEDDFADWLRANTVPR